MVKGLRNKRRPSRLQYHQNQPEYREGPRRLDEICYHSNSRGEASADAGGKNFQRKKKENNNNNNDFKNQREIPLVRKTNQNNARQKKLEQ